MNVCVFCGSATGADPFYAQSAQELGAWLASNGHCLIYGGGNIGLMGIIADAALLAGGQVTGIIPEFLMKKEVGHSRLTRLEIVGSMHERKQRMADLSDAFVALPGGLGTLEELAEILTWRQLNLIHQRVIVFNANGFFDSLLAQMERMVHQDFLRQESFAMLTVVNTQRQLFNTLSVLPV